MKNKYFKIGILSLLFMFAFASYSFAQVTLSVRYSTTDSRYHVYMTPTMALAAVSNPKLTDGSSLITLTVPTGGDLEVGTLNSVSPAGVWTYSGVLRNNGITATGAPANTDFLQFTPSGDFTLNYTPNVEVELFNFDILSGTCTGSLGVVIPSPPPPAPLITAGIPNIAEYNIGTYYSVKGYPNSIGENHYTNTYNMSAGCPVAAAPNVVTTIGQPATPLVAGSPSNIPVTLTNTGNAPATGPITTTIGLPTGTSAPATFTTNGSTCTTSGQTVTCSTPGPINSTAPTNTAVLNIPVTPATSTVGTSPTPFTAVTTPVVGETATTDNTAPPMTPTTPVAGTPDVVTTIGQPATPLVAGMPSNIPVTLTNQGTAPATGPIVTTIGLPTGTSAPASFTTNGSTCSTSGQTVTCSTPGPISNTAPNNTVVLNVPVTPATSTVGTAPGPFTATPVVPNEPTSATPNNPATPMTPTTPVAGTPDVVTTIGQPATPLVSGMPSNIPVTLTNQGTGPATGPIVTTIGLPTGTSAPASFTTNGSTCTTSGQTVTCSTPGPISNTAPTNTAVLNIPVTPATSTVGTAPGPFTATPVVPNEPTSATPNNPATPMTPTTPVAGTPDVVTTIGQPLTPFVAGTPSTVPVTLTNQGTGPATGPIVTTIGLPAGTSAPATFTTNGSTCTTSGQTVTCSTPGPISNTAPNNTAVLNIPVTPATSTVGTAPGPFTATPVVPNEPTSATPNNPATPMTPTTPVVGITAPDLTSAMGQPIAPFAVGVPSNIPVTISNIGTAATTGTTTATITLPFGMTTTPTFTSNGWTCNTSSSVVTCTTPTSLTTTGATATSTFNVPVTPNAAIVGTTPTFNSTVANAGEPTTQLSNNASTMVPTTPIAAAPAPDLVTTIGQPLTPFVAGTPSIVPVTVTNQGSAPTTGVITTTITLPAGTSAPATFTSNNNTCTTSGQTVTCTNPGPISNVVPNNTAVINVPVTPAASTVGTTPTPFTASPTTPGETVTGNNAATPMTPTTPVAATPAPDLVTTIGQPLTPFVAGTPSIVPVTVTNQGSAPTTGVITTTITLPAGTSAPATFTSNNNTCTTSGQTVTCTNPGPISNVAPNNTAVINVPVTPAASTVGTSPTPFTASPTTPGETVTGNNAATPMTPTTPVAPASIVNVKVNVKLFLQGAYETSTGMMRDDLRSRGYLPTSQPYTAMARTSYHTGTETTTFAVFSATGANAIVDWVLLELRTGTGAATRVATRAALVQRDGDVVDVDGVSPVTFTNRAAASYYIVATHRNHLGVMSEIPVALSATATTCDFTGAYDGYGNYAMKAIGNVNALWAGNANHIGITHKSLIYNGGNNDPDAVKNNVLTATGNTSALDFSFVPMGYHIGDTNLDGDVKYQGGTNDVDNMIFFNVMTHPANATVTPLHIVNENH